MVDKLTITASRRDDRGRMTFTAQRGNVAHRDKFDVDSQFHRRKFREAVIDRFGLGDDSHEAVEKAIFEAAAVIEGETTGELSTVRMADVQPEQVEWLWQDRFAIGKLGLIVGDPGKGKSFLTLDMAARISRGASWPDKPGIKQPAGDVLLLSAEDDLADTIRPRLDAHNADVSRIIAIRGAKFVDDGEERAVNLSTDLDLIRKTAMQANAPRAIIIDPVSAYLGKTDSHKNAEVRAVLSPLSALAAELRIAVIAVSHLRKGEGAALYRTMGSLAFVAAARTAWVVCEDQSNASRRLLLPLKSNLAPDVGGLAFAIMRHGMADAPALCWEAEPVSVNADDAIGHGQRKRGRPADERMDAADWLRAELANGPRPAKEIIEEGDDAGFNKRTVQRAFTQINGQRSKSGFDRGWIWSLPEGDTKMTTNTGHKQSVTFDQFCHLRQTPEEEEENTKFLSNTRYEDDSIESVSPSDPFADRHELNGEGDVPF